MFPLDHLQPRPLINNHSVTTRSTPPPLKLEQSPSNTVRYTRLGHLSQQATSWSHRKFTLKIAPFQVEALYISGFASFWVSTLYSSLNIHFFNHAHTKWHARYIVFKRVSLYIGDDWYCHKCWMVQTYTKDCMDDVSLPVFLTARAVTLILAYIKSLPGTLAGWPDSSWPRKLFQIYYCLYRELYICLNFCQTWFIIV